MSTGFQYVLWQKKRNCATDFLTREKLENARRYHCTFPEYQVTPLGVFSDTAKALGVEKLYVKDESKRFSLNAFKVLGGSYAIGNCLAEKLGMAIDAINAELLKMPEIRKKLGDMTFVTATDGNHGRGVAWAARQFGQKSVVYMPKGSAKERLENIRAEGAEASIIDGNYDDAVRLAHRMAEEKGWIMVQDTAWNGYETIPAQIMQGYGTMALEALEQLPEVPTHVFLQAGVGSMAGAVAGLLRNVYDEDTPRIVIVEPDKADCLFRTAKANDGKRHNVTGDMDTIMAGLACGEPCSIAWDVLSGCADAFISCPDYVAAKGMRILGNPAGNDLKMVSGESGAAAFGCCAEILENTELQPLKEQLGLNEHSRILFFSTEGDTDRQNYRRIVWNGAYGENV